MPTEKALIMLKLIITRLDFSEKSKEDTSEDLYEYIPPDDPTNKIYFHKRTHKTG